MPDLTGTIRLAELLTARLCHDLGGLIGTVDGAIELLADGSAPDDEVAAFATVASRALIQRLRLLRAAWGPEGDAMDLAALRDLAEGPLAGRRVRLGLDGVAADSAFPPAAARLLLNLLLLAADGLPKGGTIVAAGTPEDVVVRIDGPGAAWPSGLTAYLGHEAAAIAALGAARAVQAPLTALLALSRNARLSPVLATGGGIAAMRLTMPDRLS